MIPDVSERTTDMARLCQLYGVSRLDLFGDAATTDFPLENDTLRFLVEFDPAARRTYFDMYFGLMESLEQLFEKPVELTIDSAIRNPYLRQLVEDTKANIYVA